MVKLPSYAPEQNVSNNKAYVKLNGDGSASVDFNMQYECQQYENMLPLLSLTEQQRRDAMLKDINMSAVTLRDFSLAEHKKSYSTPHIDVSMQLGTRKLANVTGSRMFVPVGLFHSVAVPRAMQQHRQPVCIDYGFVSH